MTNKVELKALLMYCTCFIMILLMGSVDHRQLEESIALRVGVGADTAAGVKEEFPSSETW